MERYLLRLLFLTLFALTPCLSLNCWAQSSSPCPTIAPALLPQATVCEPFSVTIIAEGNGPYFWSYSGQLPPGLSFKTLQCKPGDIPCKPPALIEGSPTNPGVYEFFVNVTNGKCPVSSRNFTIVVGLSLSKAYFRFDYPPNSETSTFQLTDPQKIQTARDILSGRIKDRTHVTGYVFKGSMPYNAPWSYYYQASSIDFFEIAIELCDASMQYIENNFGEYCASFPSNQCQWCPWGSRLLEEVFPQTCK